MKGRKQNSQTVPPPDAAASTPFFARFLEDQSGGTAEAKAQADFLTLKYPSDRDEIDAYAPVSAADAT